jgi:Pyruvate/2-oxoacid:ferredoxin oxidoreductase gamma subunit
MLGCLSRFLDIEEKVWRECIINSLPAKIVAINIAAFEAGMQSIEL